MSASQSPPQSAQGPLEGLKLVEFAGLGPAPMCAMLMADLGADVVRVERPGAVYDRFTVERRGRNLLTLDLKSDAGRDAALRLIGAADALVEGFRPGVMERLGLGPDIALGRNPRLAYGRMTGWGQTGPYAQDAGHDINYIAISGALHAIGPAERPSVPLNLVGDFGAGAMLMAFGLLAAVMRARETGTGQVVDAAMSDGTVALMGMLYGHLQRGTWRDAREANIIDGGSHFYNVYRCADGEWIALGAIEPQFYAAFLEAAGISDPDFADQHDQGNWPRLKEKLAALFAARPRGEWLEILGGADCCAAPVRSMTAAPDDPHNRAREAFVQVDGVTQPGPVPKFSGTPGAARPPAPADLETVLARWGAVR